MSKYIINTNVDYADEFYYPIRSVFTQEAKNIILLHNNFLDDGDFSELYFGTNEFVSLEVSEVLEMITSAVEVTDDELQVLNKFGCLSETASIDIVDIALECLYVKAVDNGADEFRKKLENLDG